MNIKKIISLIVLCLIAASAFGQALPIRNDAPTPVPLRDLGTNMNVGKNFAVDKYGRVKVDGDPLATPIPISGTVSVSSSATPQPVNLQDPVTLARSSVEPISGATNLNGLATTSVQWVDTAGVSTTTGSTTTVLQITGVGSSARVGDILLATGGTAGNVKVWSPIIIVTTDTVTVGNAFPGAPANGDSFEIFRPVPLVSTVGSGGSYKVSPEFQLDYNYQQNSTSGLMKLEDAAAVDADAGVAAYFKREDTLSANTGTSGDYTPGKTDSSGRIIESPAPPAEMWHSCSSVASGTSDVAIKAAVASNFLYVTTIECTNTASAVSTQLNIDDAAALAWTMYVTSTTLGIAKDYAAFYPPLRMSAVNTALNVKPITTSAAVTCCASGYISTQ